ncbi:MFS transporter [Pontixanthobacter aestiaquae]|uniref:MFS transporter n=1 Tax=Pontixanthobacter aestiaquae TaxID=1509367 RepID=A0A844Z6W1_9SPHN|nr:MFS transporter [Pontixanthobacter aestiaquae]MDN3646201.1 MFS transporter [Pontixanthobacter aestiaquae]MXO82807.1 MFS transporter [Pontixanthobacter aestiaquae]
MSNTDLSETADAPRKPISRERMALLFAVMLTTAAGNTAMQSVMPSIGTELGVNDVWINLAYSWSALLWVICAPIWARRSDRRGRKSMMALGMVGFITSMGLCGMILWFGLIGALSALWTLIFFAAARSLYGGFGSAAPPAVQAYVAARTARSERTQALSLIASSFGLGTVIGPALAPLLIFPGLGLTGPFAAFTIFGVVTLIALRVLLPNDEPQFAARGSAFSAPYGTSSTDRSSEDDDDGDDADAAPRPAETPEPKRIGWFETRVRPWVIAGLLGGHAHAMILGISGFLVLDRLGLRETPLEGAGPVGVVLMCGAVATLLAQWGVIPRMNLGPRAAILWGVALASVGVILLGIAQNLHGIALGYSIASLGFGLFRPGFNAGASLAVTRAEQGEASGVVASATGAAFVFAPALGVLLYNWSEWVSFATVVALCLAVFVIGRHSLSADEVTTKDRPA